jgi:SAM-dependent methyltransferase
MTFADHFSKQATDYAKYRPSYPSSLFAWLRSLTPTHQLAWDVGTGNGQAAVELASFFDSVLATDPSAAQIKNAQPHAHVKYLVQPAEQCDLADASVDLVTVAQAIHWFDFDRFYAQVRRVLKPHGVVAAWTYTLNEVTPEVDAVVRRFYKDIVGPYWPPERSHVERQYQDIPFPFVEITAPPLPLETEWSVEDYLGYLRTWSATQRYAQANNTNPIEFIAASLRAAWGNGTLRKVHWPLYVRAGSKT